MEVCMIASRFLLGISLGCLISGAYCDDQKSTQESQSVSDTSTAEREQVNLSTEGAPESVTGIDFYSADKKFHKLLTYNHGEQTFTSTKTEKFADTAPNSSIKTYENVETLTFNDMDFAADGGNNRIVNLLELAGISELKKLKNVAFVGCKNLSDADVEQALIRCFGNVDSFNSLVISPAIGEKFPSNLLGKVQDKCTALSVLSLLINELDENTANSVAKIISSAKNNLTTLCLSIKKVSGNNKQSSLDIISNSLKDAQSLTYLAVSFENSVLPSDIKAFFENLNKSGIKTLTTMKIDLNNTKFNNPGNRQSSGMFGPVEELCKFMKSQEELREFDMSGSQLDSGFYSNIFNSGLASCTNLQRLKLNGIENFSKENMKDLGTALTKAEGIQEIEIRNCGMEQEVFSELISAIEAKTELCSLNLCNNKISDVRDIPTKCSRLISLYLANNKFSKDTLQKMIENIFKEEQRVSPFVVNLKNNINDLSTAITLHNKYAELCLPFVSDFKPIKSLFIF